MDSEKKIFLVFFFHYKSAGANDHQGIANLNPKGMVGRMYVGDHYTLLHTKSVSAGTHGYRDKDF